MLEPLIPRVVSLVTSDYNAQFGDIIPVDTSNGQDINIYLPNFSPDIILRSVEIVGISKRVGKITIVPASGDDLIRDNDVIYSLHGFVKLYHNGLNTWLMLKTPGSFTTTEVSINYTASAWQLVFMGASGKTVTLPLAKLNPVSRIGIKNNYASGGGNTTVSVTGADTIDLGASSTVSGNLAYKEFLSNGKENWVGL